MDFHNSVIVVNFFFDTLQLEDVALLLSAWKLVYVHCLLAAVLNSHRLVFDASLIKDVPFLCPPIPAALCEQQAYTRPHETIV